MDWLKDWMIEGWMVEKIKWLKILLIENLKT